LPSGQQPRTVESVDRAAAALLLFIENKAASGLSVTDIAAALKVNKSTASRLMATLRKAGFVITDDTTGRYHVGPAAYALGTRFAGAQLTRVVQFVIRDLAQQIECTAQFGILQGDQVVYLTVIESTQRLRVVARPGDARYVHCSAMGKAILAAMTTEERDNLLSSMLDSNGRLPAAGPRTMVDPRVLVDDLEKTRARGYSISEEEATRSISAVGAHVPNQLNFRTALSVAFPHNDPAAEDYPAIAERVIKAAAKAGGLLLADRQSAAGGNQINSEFAHSGLWPVQQ
jgi:DNA-binding IclR family transcriptional regulator